MKEKTNHIDILNVGLMLLSCAAAYALPFHLFLFSYAILGPLHYLTEISWLHDRHYFAVAKRSRRAWLALVAIAMAVLLYGYVANDLLHRPVPPKFEIGLVYLVFFSALLLHHVRFRSSAAVLLVAAASGVAAASSARAYFVLAYLLVTIVHVFIFTAAFVLFGALKSRSATAIASLAVYSLCAAAFFAWQPAAAPAGTTIRAAYAFFEPLNQQLLALAGRPAADIFASRAGTAVMRLIAFAYTYHYLNWFSKTSIIKWHEVPRARAIAIGGLWIAAVAVYAIDYRIGLSLLYLLSILHVLLEFPLNHMTFEGIGRELMSLARGGAASWRAAPRVPLIAPARTSGPE